MDPRLLDRRREVAEGKARRNVRRLLRFLVAAALLGGGVWLFLSPLLSVGEVRSAGIEASDSHRILAEHRVVAGTPMILLRTGAVESALERDPWIVEARVWRDWPDVVLVRIEERVPAAWVETSDGWSRRAVDGVAIPSPDSPDETMAWVQMPGIGDGAAQRSRDVVGAIEFAAALPESLVSDARIRRERNGELWAMVGGYEIRLGRPVDMGAKAASLTALLREEPPAGSVLTLVAPTHPAVTPPRDRAEAGDSAVGDDGESG